jgi:hypothetical protein
MVQQLVGASACRHTARLRRAMQGCRSCWAAARRCSYNDIRLIVDRAHPPGLFSRAQRGKGCDGALPVKIWQPSEFLAMMILLTNCDGPQFKMETVPGMTLPVSNLMDATGSSK